MKPVSDPGDPVGTSLAGCAAGSRRRAKRLGRLRASTLSHFFRRELDQLGHLALDLHAQRAFRSRPAAAWPRADSSPALRPHPCQARGQLVQQESRQGDGFAQASPERLGAEFAHIGIGIVLGRQKGKRIAMSSRSTGRQACAARRSRGGPRRRRRS